MDTRQTKKLQGVVIIIMAINLLITDAGEPLPQFAEPISNATVAVGKDVILGCVLDNLGTYKVGWVRVDTQTILSIHHRVITVDPRIAFSYNDHRSWFLHIKNVSVTDRGWYMCQVNTDPMISMKGYLQVLVPPTIADEKSSTDVTVRENSNVTLYCKANGFPEPYVMWRREDGDNFLYNGETVNVVDGEYFQLAKVSRLQMGSYLCIVSNGVPPSMSKKITVMVQFPPMLSIPNQLEGARIGDNVTLECLAEAYPASINYWTDNRGEMVIPGPKYFINTTKRGYSTRMALTIYNVKNVDFHFYKCVVKNSLGETDGVIRLEEILTPKSYQVTTTVWPSLPVSAKKEDMIGINTNSVLYIKNSKNRIIANLNVILLSYITYLYVMR